MASISSSSLSGRSSISSYSNQSFDSPGGYGTANATSLNWRLRRPAKIARRQTKLKHRKECSSSIPSPRSTKKAAVNAVNREFPLRTFLRSKSLRSRAKTLSRHTSRSITRSHRPAPLNLRNSRCFAEAAIHAAQKYDFDEWCAWLVEQRVMKRGLDGVLKSAALKLDLDEWICFMSEKGLSRFADS
ncbi:hypothetical protein MMC14_004911 [Varicellaria rhodocarpa]|nr:hypothetical protein [Varicellaria rhodocarpa]